MFLLVRLKRCSTKLIEYEVIQLVWALSIELSFLDTVSSNTMLAMSGSMGASHVIAAPPPEKDEAEEKVNGSLDSQSG